MTSSPRPDRKTYMKILGEEEEKESMGRKDTQRRAEKTICIIQCKQAENETPPAVKCTYVSPSKPSSLSVTVTVWLNTASWKTFPCRETKQVGSTC